jgi:hypothetical protein
VQLGACQVPAAVLWQSQNENPARMPGAGSREPMYGFGVTGGGLR